MRIIVLITDKTLVGVPGCNLVNPESLTVQSKTDFGNANLTMPQFLRVLINQGTGQSMASQKAARLWDAVEYKEDKLAHPDRQLYVVQARDSELQAWQRKNCRQETSDGNQ